MWQLTLQVENVTGGGKAMPCMWIICVTYFKLNCTSQIIM